MFAIIILVVESWQSGNAPDSKSGEPANTGAQVQILYSPYYIVLNKCQKPWNTHSKWLFIFFIGGE